MTSFMYRKWVNYVVIIGIGKTIVWTLKEKHGFYPIY